MGSDKYDRRAFLKTLGLSTALLPLLDTELARGATFPKRMVVVVWPNGVIEDSFWPSGNELVFGNVLSPLEPHKRDVLLLDDIENRVMMDQFPDYGGHASLPYLLTGSRARHFHQEDEGAIGDAISVDQRIANDLRARDKTAIPSLQLGIDNSEERDPGSKYISFRGPAVVDQPDAPQVMDDVHDVYRRLFGSSGMSDETLDRTRYARRSVLDLVARDLKHFGARLGSDSRQRIDRHLTAIRDMEKQLDAIPVVGDYVPRPLDAKLDPWSKDHYDRIARAQVELVVGALASGQTRVSTLLWSNGHNNSWVFKWLGDDFAKAGDGSFNPLRSHHEMAHRGDAGGADTRRKNTVDRYFISLLALLIERFKSVSEGDGTLLDHSAILFANNMGNGGSHSNDRLPWILAGSCGGYFKTGRYVRQKAPRAHNGVLVALANAMGLSTEHVGDARYGGELPGLR